MEGHTVQNDHSSPLPYTYIREEDLPDNFSWGDVDGVSYLTHSLNQHIPQYVSKRCCVTCPFCSSYIIVFLPDAVAAGLTVHSVLSLIASRLLERVQVMRSTCRFSTF